MENGYLLHLGAVHSHHVAFFRLQGRRRKAWGSGKTSLTCQCAVAGRRHADQTLKGTVKIVAVGDADQAGNVPGAGIGGLQ